MVRNESGNRANSWLILSTLSLMDRSNEPNTGLLRYVSISLRFSNGGRPTRLSLALSGTITSSRSFTL